MVELASTRKRRSALRWRVSRGPSGHETTRWSLGRPLVAARRRSPLGAKTWPRSLLIWQGNVQLLEHEQRALVQPNFDRLSCAFARLISIGSATIFEVRGIRRDVAYFTSSCLSSLPRAVPRGLPAWPRITRFDDRWRWVVTSVVPRSADSTPTRLRSTPACDAASTKRGSTLGPPACPPAYRQRPVHEERAAICQLRINGHGQDVNGHGQADDMARRLCVRAGSSHQHRRLGGREPKPPDAGPSPPLHAASTTRVHQSRFRRPWDEVARSDSVDQLDSSGEIEQL